MLGNINEVQYKGTSVEWYIGPLHTDTKRDTDPASILMIHLLNKNYYDTWNGKNVSI